MCVLTHGVHVWVWLRCLNSAYADPGALNRAEWVKFVAVFFNKEVEANNLFNTITTSYKQLNTSARAAAAAAAGGPARVAWINKFGDSLTLSYAVYKQELVTVSGLTHVLSDCCCCGLVMWRCLVTL